MKKQVVSFASLGIAICVLITANTFSGAEGEKHLVKYPVGYRDWTHVKTMAILPGHSLYETFGGIHHVYANVKALQALKEGGIYPDGSVLIFDLLEAHSKEYAFKEGGRKVLGVMEKSMNRPGVIFLTSQF